MTVGGTLALHARVGRRGRHQGESQKFEVIDNKLADLKLNTDIRSPASCGSRGSKDSSRSRTAPSTSRELLESGHVGSLRDRGDGAARRGAATKPRSLSGRARRATSALRRSSPPAAKPLRRAGHGHGLCRFRATSCSAATTCGPPTRPIAIGDMNVTVGGVAADPQGAGRHAAARRRRQHRPRQLHVPGAPLRDPARRPHPVRRHRRDRSAARHAGAARSSPASRRSSACGTMKEPELSFSSNPPLDQADILSLIVFNQPINELGEGQQVSLAERPARWPAAI